MEVENLSAYFEQQAHSFKHRLQEKNKELEEIKSAISREKTAYANLFLLLKSTIYNLNSPHISLEENGMELERIIYGQKVKFSSTSLIINGLNEKSLSFTPTKNGQRYGIDVQTNNRTLDAYHILYNDTDKKWHIKLINACVTCTDSNYNKPINYDVIYTLLHAVI
ncbi:hypothetical protein PTR80_03350 [Serratia nevei]|uniref:hypothetical protein n=1 Tax=Serratia nevei TaxID=2703794 RepID=UPI00313B8CE0